MDDDQGLQGETRDVRHGWRALKKGDAGIPFVEERKDLASGGCEQ